VTLLDGDPIEAAEALIASGRAIAMDGILPSRKRGQGVT
jgi:hypothetical protein